MILNPEKPELFHKGEDIFKALENIYGKDTYFVLQIEVRNSTYKGQYISYGVYNGLHEHWEVYDKTWKELLNWLKQKQLLLQKITL